MSPSWCVIASKQAEPSWLYALKLADNFSNIKKLILLANSAVEWVHREVEEKSYYELCQNGAKLFMKSQFYLCLVYVGVKMW